jgi:hypothetical protein
MKNTIKEQILGQKIIRVDYYEINRNEHSFFYADFDNFDLGINLEFSNGFNWHIAWQGNDRPELGIGKYIVEDHYKGFISVDATDRWTPFLDLCINDFKLEYVCEELNIPAMCSIHFSNSKKVTIVLGEELNLDDSLPLPLKYDEGPEIYVFFCQELPPIELVKFVLPINPLGDYHPDGTIRWKLKTQEFIGFVIVVLVLVVCLLAFILDL